ncbi:carbohydrate binding domain-containing protein [Spirillospora sp. NPDC047279]|uniref:carbohydrate binding domain-containing protein n=1 Tax=Spirillospora sp. NPDC047279 TaxID=3155478 RepID=UPI0033FDAC49
MKPTRLLVAVLLTVAATLTIVRTPAHAADILTNAGFESGSLAGWACSGGTGSVVSGPVRSGSYALAGAASSSDTARCTQTVAVRPGTAYTLSGWVRGGYVHLGVSVQVGHKFYGGAGGADNRTGSYLPVIHALRDALTVLHVQDYNSGPVTGLDEQRHTMGGADFHIAMTDMVKAGLPVAGTGHTPPAQVQQALDCLVKGQSCGGHTLRGGTSPALRGLMTWSINWDRYFNREFMNNHEPFLNALP